MTDGTTPPPPPTPAQPVSGSDDKTWLILGHLGIILFGFLPPLIVWLVGKDRSANIDTEGKEALNFGITISIAYVVGYALSWLLIPLLLVLAAFIASLVFCIQAAIATNNGQSYRYPFALRLVK